MQHSDESGHPHPARLLLTKLPIARPSILGSEKLLKGFPQVALVVLKVLEGHLQKLLISKL